MARFLCPPLFNAEIRLYRTRTMRLVMRWIFAKCGVIYRVLSPSWHGTRSSSANLNQAFRLEAIHALLFVPLLAFSAYALYIIIPAGDTATTLKAFALLAILFLAKSAGTLLARYRRAWACALVKL